MANLQETDNSPTAEDPGEVRSVDRSQANSQLIILQRDLPQESAHVDAGRRALHRLNHAFGPVAAGMIIDAVDIVTFGPVGLILGIPVGGIAGYWLGRSMRLERHMCWICCATAAIYCSIPGTELLPLGTLVGALVRFQDEPSSE